MNNDRNAKSVGGFTLLEVLLAVGLSAVMLGALWTLLSMQMRLFAEDPVRVTRAQLVRSLLQLLAEDLESVLPAVPAKAAAEELGLARGVVEGAADDRADGVIEQQDDPAAGAAAIGSSSRRSSAGAVADTAVDFTTPPNSEFGLIGTPESLQFDVLRPVPALIRSADDTAGTYHRGRRRNVERSSRVPEMCRVTYRFEPPPDNRRSAAPEPSGLIRQAWHWETRAQHESEPGPLSELQQPAGRAASETGNSYEPSQQRGSDYRDEPADGSRQTDVVPEVVELEFRYFDGTRWSSWWDSQSMGRLPQAVELRMRLAMDEQKREPPAAARLETGPEESNAATQPPRQDSFFRTVVYLPAARKSHAQPRTGLSSGTGTDTTTLSPSRRTIDE